MNVSTGLLLLFLFMIVLAFAGGYFLKEMCERMYNRKMDATQIGKEIETESEMDQARWQRVDQAVDAERKRIARELHDDTVQRMVAVRLRLEQILYYPVHEGVTKEVTGLRKELDNIVAALRFLINDLTQPRFDLQPFSSLIDELAATLGAMHHIKLMVKSTQPELEFSLQPHLKQELYYLIHEVTHNFLKSSMGFQLTIHLHWSDQLIIHLKDNGQGLQRGRGYGMGMVSMHERANRIQAELVVTSMNDGMGVTIKVKKPQLY